MVWSVIFWAALTPIKASKLISPNGQACHPDHATTISAHIIHHNCTNLFSIVLLILHELSQKGKESEYKHTCLWPRAHFTKDFSIVIQIWCKFNSAIIQLDTLSAMKLSTWHKSCAIGACAKFCSDLLPYNGVTPKLIFIKFELQCKNCSWNGPQIAFISIFGWANNSYNPPPLMSYIGVTELGHDWFR